MLKKINSKEDFNNTIKEGTWLVDFSAKWCGPCRMLEPVLENISKSNNVIQIDIDEAIDLTEEYGIMSVPTLLVFKEGELKNKSVGYASEEELTDLLK